MEIKHLHFFTKFFSHQIFSGPTQMLCVNFSPVGSGVFEKLEKTSIFAWKRSIFAKIFRKSKIWTNYRFSHGIGQFSRKYCKNRKLKNIFQSSPKVCWAPYNTIQRTGNTDGIITVKDGCMDWWMDGWMHGWMNAWMDGWVIINAHKVNVSGTSIRYNTTTTVKS